MTCRNCNKVNVPTIKAHLIPRVFCVQVKQGASIAANLIAGNDQFEISQSGLWDDEILCGKCDGKIGNYEGYTHKVLEAIRYSGSKNFTTHAEVEGADYIKVLRCCAGILYKFSLTTDEKGKISLGKYQEICRKIAFEDQDIPISFDVLVIRLALFENDTSVFAYRNPKMDRKEGLNYFRLMIGGVLFFIKVDQRPFWEEMREKSLQFNKRFFTR